MNEFLFLIIGLIVTSIIYFVFTLKNKTYELKEIKRAGYFEIKSQDLPMKITYKEEYRFVEPWTVTKITCFRGKIYDGELSQEEKDEIVESTRKRKKPAKPAEPEGQMLPPPPPITSVKPLPVSGEEEETKPAPPSFTFPTPPPVIPKPEEKEEKKDGDTDTEWSFGRPLND